LCVTWKSYHTGFGYAVDCSLPGKSPVGILGGIAISFHGRFAVGHEMGLLMKVESC